MPYRCGTTLITAFVSFFCSCCSGQQIGDRCSTNSGCSAESSWCYVASPTCGGVGYCACRPGFVQIASNATPISTACYASRPLGSHCGPYDVCNDPNAECNLGRCTCTNGFTAANSGSCVSLLKNVRAGEQCFDSVQCIGQLVCINNQCGCYPEYSLSGCCDCVKKGLGDSCSIDSDCGHASNSTCSQGVCNCDRYSKTVSYITITTAPSLSSTYQQLQKCVTRLACVPPSYQLGNEGDTCSEPDAVDPRVPFQLCKTPFVCTSCSISRRVCATKPTVCFRLLQNSGSLPASMIAASVIGALCVIALVSLLIQLVTSSTISSVSSITRQFFD